MFGKKSRLERENDALEERINELKRDSTTWKNIALDLELKYRRNLREYRYTQKACERRKRANRRLRTMLDDVGWPKNDRKPNLEEWKAERKAHQKLNKPERLVPRKLP